MDIDLNTRLIRKKYRNSRDMCGVYIKFLFGMMWTKVSETKVSETKVKLSIQFDPLKTANSIVKDSLPNGFWGILAYLLCLRIDQTNYLITNMYFLLY